MSRCEVMATRRQTEYQRKVNRDIRQGQAGMQQSYMYGAAAPKREYKPEWETPKPYVQPEWEAVPKRSYEPAGEPGIQQPVRKKRQAQRTYVGTERVHVSPATYRNRQKALYMNGRYVCFLVVAAVISLMFCVNYLKLQAEITNRSEQITAMEKEINTLKSQNDSLEYSIDSYVDLEYIYKVATEEMGMILATENQVSLYESTENEYMKQVGDIPEVE